MQNYKIYTPNKRMVFKKKKFPKGINLTTTKWVYSLKRDSNREI
jgi:hypothetical protein